MLDARSISRVATDGGVRWTMPLWHAMQARFTSDGATIVVATSGGVVALDAETGARRATGCGWGFGLHRERPPELVFGVPVVCAEDAR